MQICILIHSNLASQIPGLIIMLREKALWYSHTSFGAITKPQITFLRLSRDLLLTADVEGGTGAVVGKHRETLRHFRTCYQRRRRRFGSDDSVTAKLPNFTQTGRETRDLRPLRCPTHENCRKFTRDGSSSLTCPPDTTGPTCPTRYPLEA